MKLYIKEIKRIYCNRLYILVEAEKIYAVDEKESFIAFGNTLCCDHFFVIVSKK